MEIKKMTTISVQTTDGKELMSGDMVAFTLNNKDAHGFYNVGIYMGLGAKNSLIIKSVDSDVKKNIMPSSIEKMYVVESFRLNKESE